MFQTATTHPEDLQFVRINEDGMAAYAATVKDLAKAFEPHSMRSCACIDEGIPGGYVRIAGSGILHAGGAYRIADILLAADVTEVTSHEVCGAAALWTKNNGGDVSDVEQNGILFAKEVARIMMEKGGVPVTHRHITLDEMVRPRDYHSARVVYYDTTGRFNPTQCAELPLGFVVSHKHLRDEEQYAFDNAKLAAQIALGAHGLGEFFTQDNPFRIVIVADDEESASENSQVLLFLENEFDNRVAVDWLVV